VLPRLFAGTAFLFDGYGKIADIAGFTAELGIPYLMAAVTTYVQFGAGLLLILGSGQTRNAV
jgi:uncharacterized membrane protein YphA (DoxX/SURF4 family)